jgi:hypothetical protein
MICVFAQAIIIAATAKEETNDYGSAIKRKLALMPTRQKLLLIIHEIAVLNNLADCIIPGGNRRLKQSKYFSLIRSNPPPVCLPFILVILGRIW